MAWLVGSTPLNEYVSMHEYGLASLDEHKTSQRYMRGAKGLVFLVFGVVRHLDPLPLHSRLPPDLCGIRVSNRERRSAIWRNSLYRCTGTIQHRRCYRRSVACSSRRCSEPFPSPTGSLHPLQFFFQRLRHPHGRGINARLNTIARPGRAHVSS